MTAAPYRRLRHFNPRSPHGERPHQPLHVELHIISIHAPRTGSDQCAGRLGVQLVISIHAPRTGSDGRSRAVSDRRFPHFNPRSPHGERPNRSDLTAAQRQFQSTLPARGATTLMVVQPPAGTYFNPRSPHGERQDFFGSHVFFLLISIHAPRTGSDGRPAPERSRAGHFNPRSPHGERRIRFTTCRPSSSFQSTLPARGATKPYFVYQNHVINVY